MSDLQNSKVSLYALQLVPSIINQVVELIIMNIDCLTDLLGPSIAAFVIAVLLGLIIIVDGWYATS